VKSVIFIFCVSVAAATRLSAENLPTNAYAIYDPEPAHLWNRLFVAFYCQNITNDLNYGDAFQDPPQKQVATNLFGPDVLDPPIGYDPHFLLDDVPFAKVNALLDELLDNHGGRLIHDPLKRAMLQRDLWAVFDVLAQAATRADLPMGSIEGAGLHSVRGNGVRWALTLSQKEHRDILEIKLARAIQSLALTRSEIQTLPDSYSAAIAPGAFSDVLSSNRYNYLPHDLFATNSEWREILPAPPIPGGAPGILEHTLVAGGRCVFRTFMRLPPVESKDSRNAHYGRKGLLPEGTGLLLLREMISLDESGKMTPTHVVESVQFRTLFNNGPRIHGFAREAELSRVLLFQGSQGGLRPIAKGELRVERYDGLGHLRVDEEGYGPPLVNFPRNCVLCHNGNFLLTTGGKPSEPRRNANIQSIIRWKEKQGKLDLLQRLMFSQPPGNK
jgi:hypothetical protein